MIWERLYPRYQRHFPAPIDGQGDVTFDQVWEFMCDNWNPETMENPWRVDTREYLHFETQRATADRTRYRRYLDLPDAPVVRLPSKRRMPQPTLKVPYDNLHDIRLRLQGTLIFIGSILYYVRDVVEIEHEFLLTVEDKDGQRFKCWYKNEAIDLRSLEPQYIRHAASPGFLCRSPSRVQQQGMRFENLYCKRVGREDTVRFEGIRDLIDGVTTDVHAWSPAYSDLMLKVKALPSIRLSKNVAVFTSKGRLMAEYRGRRLGEIKEDTVFIDRHDASKPWIKEAVSMVGFNAEQRDA